MATWRALAAGSACAGRFQLPMGQGRPHGPVAALSKWSQLGVSYADGRALPSDNMPASLLLPMGRMGPAFLAYANFGVYTEWNNSLIYSTTAGYLATRIAGAPPMVTF